MSAEARARPAQRARLSMARREELTGYLWIAPWLVGFVAFTLGPALASLAISLVNLRFGSGTTFVGLDNYVWAITKDPLFWSSLLRSGYYTLLVVPVGVVASLLAATLLNQGMKGTSVYRTMFFMPSLTPIVATAALWAWILAADIGPLNNALALVGIKGPRWFGQAEWAIPAIAIIVLWGAVGGSRMITFLAGLQGVPQELYDAASIDGANALERFLHVTLPLLTPVVFFNVVLGIIGSFQVFEVAFVATQGGPGEATYFYALHVYNKAFRDFEFGYASALAWVFFLILIVFTQLQFRASAKWVYYEGETK
ncbi:MAG TPA: sugar ABC transporter permease [Chloroflexota bacterium]|nr:sugar ABC transporter permease [Chloroflexota bacterium]